MLANLKQVFVLGIPALVAVAGASVAISEVRLFSRLRWVRGRVVGHEQTTDSEGRLYWIRFQYEAGGQQHELRDSMAFGWKAKRPGAEVWVGFLPEKSNQGRIWRLWPAAIGLLLFILGIAVVWLAGTRR